MTNEYGKIDSTEFDNCLIKTKEYYNLRFQGNNSIWAIKNLDDFNKNIKNKFYIIHSTTSQTIIPVGYNNEPQRIYYNYIFIDNFGNHYVFKIQYNNFEEFISGFDINKPLKPLSKTQIDYIKLKIPFSKFVNVNGTYQQVGNGGLGTNWEQIILTIKECFNFNSIELNEKDKEVEEIKKEVGPLKQTIELQKEQINDLKKEVEVLMDTVKQYHRRT